MIIPLPGGSEIDIGNDLAIVAVDAVTLHTPKALGRLIEYWRNKPNLRAWQSSYTDELQLIENMFWEVISSKLLDQAGTDQLDKIGRIVGEPRNGLGNVAYRLRIRVRILINSSYGQAPQIITIIKKITAARFRHYRYGIAAYRVDFSEPLESAIVAEQLPLILEEISPAGVGFAVTYPITAVGVGGGASYGWGVDLTANAHAGYGWSGDPTVGGRYGHGV